MEVNLDKAKLNRLEPTAGAKPAEKADRPRKTGQTRPQSRSPKNDRTRISSEARRETGKSSPARLKKLSREMENHTLASAVYNEVGKILASSNPNMTKRQMTYYLTAGANLIGKEDWVGAGMLERQNAQDGLSGLTGVYDSFKLPNPQPVVGQIAGYLWKINPKLKPAQLKDTLLAMAEYNSMVEKNTPNLNQA